MQKRRFVVTGGSGFVGQFLIKKLSSLYPDSEIHNIDIHHPIGLGFSNVSNHMIDLTDQQSLKYLGQVYFYILFLLGSERD